MIEAKWASCEVPLSSCLIRDTYPDAVRYYGLVTTKPDIPASILRDNGYRWTL